MTGSPAEDLGYAGKRVIVFGAGQGTGAVAVGILVRLGAEVHAVGARRPDVRDLASFTEADVTDRAARAGAITKIGAVVNALFHCGEPLDAGALADVVTTVAPVMIDGAAVAAITTELTVGALAEIALPVRPGIRVNCVAAAGPPEAQAWPLVFLNSPRASLVNGAMLGFG
jgi:D-arabinose 1-dehydrogenase-like Zn-dependent alcohol dehydrogenase